MATWQYSMYVLPEGYVTASKTSLDKDFVDKFPGWENLMVTKISDTVKGAFGAWHSSPSGVIFGDIDGSCVSLRCKDHDKSVEEIFVRLDLRRAIKSEVTALFELSRSINALIVTEDFRIVPPGDITAMKQALESSIAFRFVKDPIGYLRSLDFN